MAALAAIVPVAISHDVPRPGGVSVPVRAPAAPAVKMSTVVAPDGPAAEGGEVTGGSARDA
ncbi:hypothetical protein [Parafrankia sp. FMc2]|uniref:hypothetical protein n=1 Tax=Parafrankia sp. FMc2 TaxID=3233196 RepID=UPI0034D74020